jgi:hypothetical protein
LIIRKRRLKLTSLTIEGEGFRALREIPRALERDADPGFFEVEDAEKRSAGLRD